MIQIQRPSGSFVKCFLHTINLRIITGTPRSLQIPLLRIPSPELKHIFSYTYPYISVSNIIDYQGTAGHRKNFCFHFFPAIRRHCISYEKTLQVMADNKYLTGYAKLGTSSCKKCKQKIEKGALRIAKVVANPFSEDAGDMKQWYHPACMFETFVRARATTKKIEDPDDVEGFSDLQQEDKDTILKLIKGTLLSLSYILAMCLFSYL